MLNDLIGKNSGVKTLDFKNFVEKELKKEKIKFMIKNLILEICILLKYTLNKSKKKILKGLNY